MSSSKMDMEVHPSISTLTMVKTIGAGTMGQGIAQAGALAGYDVVLYDVAEGIFEETVY